MYKIRVKHGYVYWYLNFVKIIIYLVIDGYYAITQ